MCDILKAKLFHMWKVKTRPLDLYRKPVNSPGQALQQQWRQTAQTDPGPMRVAPNSNSLTSKTANKLH